MSTVTRMAPGVRPRFRTTGEARFPPRLGLATAFLAGALFAAAPASAQNPAVGPERQVALVTGSTSGLGTEVATRLAAQGMHVIIHGRSEERATELVRELQAAGGSASYHLADFAALAEVRELAGTILANYGRLDLLVNNAGISRGGGQRSVDGHELTFQVNYLAHFLLTHELLPLLERSAPARIVHVASAAQTPIQFDDVMLERPGAANRAYGQSKLAQIMHTFDLAEQLAGTGIIVNVLHPATFMDTPMVTSGGRQPMSTVGEGADAVMQLITGDVETGGYYDRMSRVRANDQAYDLEARTRLRELSRRLVGIED